MYIQLLCLAVIAAILVAFLGGLRCGIVTLIILRPLCDRLFEQARFSVGGHDLSYGAAINFIVIGAMLVNLPRINNRTQILLERSWLPFLLVGLAASLYSPVQIDALRKLLTYVSYMAMFVLPFAIVRTRGGAEFLFKAIILSSLLPALYGLFQVLSGHDWYQGNRIESTFTHPNIFSFYLLTTIGTILSLLVTNRVRLTRRARSILAVYVIPLLLLIVATKTRSAWIGCMALFLVYGVLHDKRVLVLTLLLPVLALAVPSVRDRLMTLASGNQYVGWVQDVNAFAWRKILWAKAFPLILQHPILGHGLYSFPYYSPTFFPLETTRGVDAHNVYVQLAFETGFAGLAAYVWIFWRKFAALLRHWRSDTHGLTMVAAMICVYLINCYSDNLLEYVSYDWCYWFTVGLIFADLSQYRAAVASPARRSGLELHPMGASNVRSA
jgi:O-antigen ligase